MAPFTTLAQTQYFGTPDLWMTASGPASAMAVVLLWICLPSLCESVAKSILGLRDLARSINEDMAQVLDGAALWLRQL